MLINSSGPRQQEEVSTALAAVSGVKSETIRYYESIQLLPSPKRRANNHRLYEERHRDRLRFIRRARELGFTLAEVQGLLDLVDNQTLSCAEVKQVTQLHLEDIYNKINDLRNMAKVLNNFVRQCDGNQSPHCAIIENLFAHGNKKTEHSA